MSVPREPLATRAYRRACAVPVAIAAVSLSLVSCGELLGLDSLKDRPDGSVADSIAPPVDARSEEAVLDAGLETSSACALALPPPAPSQGAPGTVTVVAIVRTIDFGQRPDGGPAPLYGYDLDGVDTCCMGGPQSCIPPEAGTIRCDEEGGRDNYGGQMLQVARTIGGRGLLDQATLNASIDSGLFSLGVVIRSYNGQPSDTQMIVGAFASNGTELAVDGGRPPTRWDGTDVWTVDQGSVFGLDEAGVPAPLEFDRAAYVTGGTLVANLTQLPLAFAGGNGGSAVVTLRDAIVTGTLVSDQGSFRIDDGQMSGRVKLTDLFQLLHTLPNPFGSGYVCPGTVAYTGMKAAVCANADIASAKSNDNAGGPCDAISVSLGFTAVPALVGSITGAPASPSPCLDAAPEQCP